MVCSELEVSIDGEADGDRQVTNNDALNKAAKIVDEMISRGLIAGYSILNEATKQSVRHSWIIFMRDQLMYVDTLS